MREGGVVSRGKIDQLVAFNLVLLPNPRVLARAHDDLVFHRPNGGLDLLFRELDDAFPVQAEATHVDDEVDGGLPCRIGETVIRVQPVPWLCWTVNVVLLDELRNFLK